MLAAQCQASEQLLRVKEKSCLYWTGLLMEFVLEHVTCMQLNSHYIPLLLISVIKQSNYHISVSVRESERELVQGTQR
jgi:hypothetical protein